MALYSNACKSMCAKMVVAISVVIGLLGLITLVMGLGMSGNAPSLGGKLSLDFGSNASLGQGMMILGALVLVTGILGCLTAKFKKPWFAILFIILTFILGLVLIIVGGLSAFGSQVYSAVGNAACDAARSNNLYNEYKKAVDQRMCSDDCKCNEEYKSLWQTDYNAGSGSRSQGWNNAGRDFNSFKWSSNPDEYFNSWNDCYTAKLERKFGGSSDETKFLQEYGFAAALSFEEEFDCAGFCKVPLFYMTRALEEGPPTQGCFPASIKGMEGKLGNGGMIALVTGLIALVGMIGACPLCSGFENKE